MTWWHALRARWLLRKARRQDQARRRQRREVTRLELAYRLDQAERMSKAYVEAWGKERDRLIRQLDVLRARQAELDEILRTIRTGVQVLAVEEAAARAREAAVSGFGDFDGGEYLGQDGANVGRSGHVAQHFPL